MAQQNVPPSPESSDGESHGRNAELRSTTGITTRKSASQDVADGSAVVSGGAQDHFAGHGRNGGSLLIGLDSNSGAGSVHTGFLGSRRESDNVGKSSLQQFASASASQAMRRNRGLSMKLTHEDGTEHSTHRGTTFAGVDGAYPPPTAADLSRSVGSTEAILFLRYARRVLRDGLYVYQLRINATPNKLSRVLTKRGPRETTAQQVFRSLRQLYVGYQPEYLELTTERQVETILHMSAITAVTSSPSAVNGRAEFARYKSSTPARPKDPAVLHGCVTPVLNKKLCLVIESGSDQSICLLFGSELERRVAQFHIMVERRVLQDRYTNIEKGFAALCAESKVNVSLARSVLDK